MAPGSRLGGARTLQATARGPRPRRKHHPDREPTSRESPPAADPSSLVRAPPAQGLRTRFCGFESAVQGLRPWVCGLGSAAPVVRPTAAARGSLGLRPSPLPTHRTAESGPEPGPKRPAAGSPSSRPASLARTAAPDRRRPAPRSPTGSLIGFPSSPELDRCARRITLRILSDGCGYTEAEPLPVARRSFGPRGTHGSSSNRPTYRALHFVRSAHL